MDAFFGKQGKSIPRSALALAINERIPSGSSGCAGELCQEVMKERVGEDRDGVGAPGGRLTALVCRGGGIGVAGGVGSARIHVGSPVVSREETRVARTIWDRDLFGRNACALILLHSDPLARTFDVRLSVH